jgi:hypothetical protein
VQLLAAYVDQEVDAAVNITAAMVAVDLLITLGDGMCRHMDCREGSSLLLALLRKANSAPRPASASPGKRPGTAAMRRLQEEWRTTPAGVADLALRCREALRAAVWRAGL